LRSLVLLVLCVFVFVPSALAGQAAQPPAPPPAQERTDAVRIFLDCDSCDENYIRTELTFVNYVRDRTEADVHVLITTQGTGGGGTEYTLKFIGLGRFQGVDNSLVYASPQTATSDERREGLLRVLKLGLVRYVAGSRVGERLKLQFDEPKNQQTAASVRDPWNFWVFRVGASGSFEGEESGTQRDVSASFSANRTTERWKINFNGFTEYEMEKFVLDEEDEETFTSIQRASEGRAIVVKSLTQHWSVGGTFAVANSTFQNYEFRGRLAPGIEFNFFPYSESTRRILTAFYSVGVQRLDYIEETIFGKLQESALDHQLEIGLGLRQPWGSASGELGFSQFLDDPSKYRLSGFGEIDIRLFKGFSVEFFGSASRRRDQISLRRGDATPEEILVRQRELFSGYQYDFGFGLSYSFGSIFNNVVNPRFRNVGGF
jgi:hypothetical protein